MRRRRRPYGVEQLSSAALMAWLVELAQSPIFDRLTLSPAARLFVRQMPEKWVARGWLTMKRRRWAENILIDAHEQLQRRKDLRVAREKISAKADQRVAHHDLRQRLEMIEAERALTTKLIAQLEAEHPLLTDETAA